MKNWFWIILASVCFAANSYTAKGEFQNEQYGNLTLSILLCLSCFWIVKVEIKELVNKGKENATN